MPSLFAALAASTKRTFAGVRTRAQANANTASTSTTSTTSTPDATATAPRKTSPLSQYNADLSFGESDARFNFEQCLAAAVATAEFVEAGEQQLGEAVVAGSDDSHIVRSAGSIEDSPYTTIDEHDFFAGPFEFLMRRESIESVDCAFSATSVSQLSLHAASLEYHLAFYNASNNSLNSSVSGSTTSLTTSDDASVSASFVTPPSSVERCSVASTSTRSSCAPASCKAINKRTCTACRAQEGTYEFEWQKPLYLLPPRDCTCFATASARA